MLPLSDAENDFASACVAEFSQQHSSGVALSFECIYRSHDFSDTRLVLKVTSPSQNYALKIDTESPETGRLQKEFTLLRDLCKHFSKTGSSRAIQPIYLSPSHTFFVTEFIDRPTAVDIVHNSSDDDQVAQVYRRAGAWLHDFHSFRPSKEYGFRPRWMTESIQDLLHAVPPDILGMGQPMADELEKTAHFLKGIPETQVFAHGDFHGQNLIVGQGEMIGLDFTEAREKLAVYDIVDFLKSDIFRDANDGEVDQSGILRKNKAMFFRRYRHPINMDILDFCIRGRILKDWLDLCRTDRVCSVYEDFRRTRLRMRLETAFRNAT